MARVVQISDSHLSPAKRHFQTNWAPLRAFIVQHAPDVTIHTGDLTVDGADDEADIEHCADLLRGLPGTVLAVPGNHDVGEAGHPHQPINAQRLARWRRHLGPDWWSHDLENWRLIGLDSMLFGEGGDEELRQFEWLEHALATAGGRRIAWFTHRPLFLEHPDEHDTGYWSVKPAPRARLLELADRHDVAVVGTGHLHRWQDAKRSNCRYIWCASSGFLVGPDNQPEMPGEKRLGAVVYDFHGSEVAIAWGEVPGLTTLWIDDVIHDVYPRAVPQGRAAPRA